MIPANIINIIIKLATNKTRRKSLLGDCGWTSYAYVKKINAKIEPFGWQCFYDFVGFLGNRLLIKNSNGKIYDVSTQIEVVLNEQRKFYFLLWGNPAELMAEEPTIFELDKERWQRMSQTLQVWADQAEEAGFLPISEVLNCLAKKSHYAFLATTLLPIKEKKK
jgi:hypothetical protein